MKAAFSFACGLILLADTSFALTVFNTINTEGDCPPNLKLKIEPPRADREMALVTVVLTPNAPEGYRGRVDTTVRLRTTRDDAPQFAGKLATIRQGESVHCRFQIHPAALRQTKLTVSTSLREKDGHPTVGGGVIYEIDLRGFFPAPRGNNGHSGHSSQRGLRGRQ